MQIHIDSFSGACADLPRAKRSADDVLAVLRRKPFVSCFDLSEHAWLRVAILDLERAGAIIDDGTQAYPWIRYKVTPNAELSGAGSGAATEPGRSPASDLSA